MTGAGGAVAVPTGRAGDDGDDGKAVAAGADGRSGMGPGGIAEGGVLAGVGGAITGRGATGVGVETTTGTGGSAGFTAAGAAVVGRLTAAGGAATVFSTTAVGAAIGAAGGGVGRGGAGATAVSFRCVIAFRTSPGREIFDRSILVLISSSPRLERELDLPPEEGPSPVERIYKRTFSASCSSRELECVFFSVTPTIGSVSRMALLFTSSSRARSLIRTLLIRPFGSPCCS
jgi:hypothetical protein